MTEEQKVTAKRFRSEAEKDLLISRMLESPAELSDDEITQILSDDELRDIYSISVDIKTAKRNQTEIDASAEWKRFMPKLVKPRRWNSTILARAAVILVGVLLVSAGIFLMTNRGAETEVPLYAENDDIGNQKPNVKEIQATDTTTVDETIPESQKRPTDPQRCSKPMLAKASRSQNEATPQTVDVEEYVRIQQARMDNDLAMQQAEAMVNQYYAMVCLSENIEPNFDNAGKMPTNLGDGYSMDDEILTLIIP